MLMPFWVGISLGLIAHLILNISTCSSTSWPPEGANAESKHDTIDIKIGFLVGSRRAKNERSYPRPGKQLVHTFNYALDKINQEFSKNTHRHLQEQNQDYIRGLDKQQQQPTETQRNDTEHQALAKIIRFVPIIAETHGNESESIKETIGLITKHRVNFIVGPQESCQIESRLAGVFNVGMISHYCPQYKPASSGQQQDFLTPPQLLTFIQTKPPHWKIVKRATTLVSQLLSAYNGQWYPQQLVLLYFKEQSPVSGGGGSSGRRQAQTMAASSDNNKRGNSSGSWTPNSSPGPNRGRWQDHQTYMASDAIQYKLIGELLEIELNQLFSPAAATPTDPTPVDTDNNRKWRQQQHPVAKPPLTVLNWHTTFHYGFTKNPFRQLIRRHLFRQPPGSNFVHPSSSTTFNQSSSRQCVGGNGDSPKPLPAQVKELPLGDQQQTMSNVLHQQPVVASVANNRKTTAAIYVIVGHYYEHLGLMLALDELNLLGIQQQQNPSAEKPHQSSALVNQDQQQQQRQRQESLVIGVDIEQYDERDDSLRFLRGLLMDERHRSSSDLDSIANMYRNYMGVVPAKPTRMADFLEDMRIHYNQTATQQQQQQQRFPPDDLDSASNVGPGSRMSANQTTLDSIQLTGRLFQFIRLPIEAFYLYDSIMLLGSYFTDCIQHKQLTLAQCSDGRRAFEWFRDREYISFVDQNLTKFDSQAQTNGHYTLITRKSVEHVNDSSPASEPAEDGDFGLMPVGRFIDSSSSSASNSYDDEPQQLKIELNVEADDIDPVWLPFWCHLKQLTNSSECEKLAIQLNSSHQQPPPVIIVSGDGPLMDIHLFTWLVGVALVFGLMAAFVYYQIHTNHGRGGLASGYVNQIGWFDERDEQNFLEIVHKFLMTPEISNDEPMLCDDQQILFDHDDRDLKQEPKSVVELHCHMFPFPSCRFVHWLTALHQLKELVFQYHSSLAGELSGGGAAAANGYSRSSNNPRKVNLGESYKIGWIKSLTSFKFCIPTTKFSRNPLKTTNCNNNHNRGFFRSKHKATASLRILLNKYKSINQSFCDLNHLDHHNIVKLYGATLSRSATNGICGERIVHLMVGAPDRGNLREALGGLFETMDPRARETIEFRQLVVMSSIRNLIDGLDYLHRSKVQFHGELRATNCLISSDWHLKLSGFHAFHMRRSLGNYEQKIASSELAVNLQNLIYSAPEVLADLNRRCSLSGEIMRLADFYSFAFIVYELLVGQEPWTCLTHVTSSKLLLERIQAEPSFRPPLSLLDNKEPLAMRDDHLVDLDAVQSLLRSCWSQSPERRPQSIAQLRLKLQKAFKLPPTDEANLQLASCNHVMKSYAKLLERISICRKRCLEHELKRSEEMWLRLLPERIVAKLYSNQPVPVQKFDCVSLCQFRFVLAADEPRPLELLNEILIQLDVLIETYRKRVHPLDSQVDSSLRHLIFSGEPVFSPKADARKSSIHFNHCQLLASFALQLIDLVNKWQTKSNSCFQLKCGLHCGPAVGGLINTGGRQPFEGAAGAELHTRRIDPGNSSQGPSSSSSCFNAARYVLYGNTLEMADILESTCMTQRIQVSGEFRSQILQNLNHQIRKPHELTEFGSKTTIDGGSVSVGCDSRQGYVMIRREAKISSKTFGEFEAYWLLNGPRLTASQSIMLLSESERTNYGAT